MPRRRRTSRRSSYSSPRRSARRFRSTSRRAQRLEIVVRNEPSQPIAAPMPMVVDNGRLKIAGDGPKVAKF